MEPKLGEATNSPKKWAKIKRLQILNNKWVSTVFFIAGVVVVYFFIQSFLIRTYLVDGQSMEMSLQNGDRLIIDKVPRTLSKITKHAYIPHRGDIIVFDQSGLSIGLSGKKQLIKRVVGLPGERVVVKNGSLRIYSQTYPDGYDPDKAGLYHIDAPTTSGNLDITLGDGKIFVCGDNRSNSEDSRIFGPVAADQIVGKLSLRLLPLSKAHKF